MSRQAEIGTDIVRWKIVHAKVIIFLEKLVFFLITIHPVKIRNCFLNFISNFFFEFTVHVLKKQKNFLIFLVTIHPVNWDKNGQQGGEGWIPPSFESWGV